MTSYLVPIKFGQI